MGDERFHQEAPIDFYTNNLVNLALEIAKAEKPGYFEGGLAIDFAVGRITRNHHDIDFHPLEEDLDWWLNWFDNRGYTHTKYDSDGWDKVYKINDGEEEIVDLWPIKVINDDLFIMRRGTYIPTESHRIKKWSELLKVNYKGVEVIVDDPKEIVRKKKLFIEQGKPNRIQDRRDFELVEQVQASSLK